MIATSLGRVGGKEGAQVSAPFSVFSMDPLELHRRFEKISNERLLELFQRSVMRNREEWALVLGRELTFRRIAPVFRWGGNPSKVPLDDDARSLLRLLDLQWLRSRFPRHQSKWARYSGCFHVNEQQAQKAWRFAIGNNGWRKPTHLIDGLGLPASALLELAGLVPANLLRRRTAAFVWQRHANVAICSAMEKTRDRRGKDEKAATLVRRQKLWLCGALCRDSPQQAATLYSLMPDCDELPRNTVGRELGFVSRAVRKYKQAFAANAQNDE